MTERRTLAVGTIYPKQRFSQRHSPRRAKAGSRDIPPEPSAVDKLRSAVSAIFKDSRDELRRLRDHELKGNWLGYRELHIERKWLNIPCRPPTPSPVTRASRANLGQ